MNNLRSLQMVLMVVVLGLAFSSSAAETNIISKVLDDFHDAASKADGKRYFNHFTRDAIFLGTDATERWSLTEFQAYAKPHFDKGKGWTYTSKSRHVYISTDGKTAWFDENLTNKSLGLCRGSGVLQKKSGKWKIAQYNLTIPIPNAMVKDVANKIAEGNPKTK